MHRGVDRPFSPYHGTPQNMPHRIDRSLRKLLVERFYCLKGERKGKFDFHNPDSHLKMAKRFKHVHGRLKCVHKQKWQSDDGERTKKNEEAMAVFYSLRTNSRKQGGTTTSEQSSP